jgi:hypothetical protein
MKHAFKTLIVSLVAFAGITVQAQEMPSKSAEVAETRIYPNGNPNSPFEIVAGSNRTTSAPAGMTEYGSDVIIDTSTTLNQDLARLAFSSTGTGFVIIADTALQVNPVRVYRTTNSGQTWSLAFSVNGTYRVRSVSMSVPRNDTLHVAFVYELRDTLSGVFIATVRTTGLTLLGSYDENVRVGNFTYYRDVSLATDAVAQVPAGGTSPFGAGALVSKGGLVDSVLFLGSVNAGVNFRIRRVVETTSTYFGRTTLAYAYNNNFGFGRYCGAFERTALDPGNYIPASQRTGNIGYSVAILSSPTSPDTAFRRPVYIDSVLGGTNIRNWRRPSLAVQFIQQVNDSNSITGVLAAEDVANNRAIFVRNKRAVGSGIWTLATSSLTHPKHPSVAFDRNSNRFLRTSWDSAGGRLQYANQPESQILNSTWATVTEQYNSTVTGVESPEPQVALNRAVSEAGHVWIQRVGGRKRALFDAEFLNLSVQDTRGGAGLDYKLHQNYPNPFNPATTIGYQLPVASEVKLEIYDMLGRKVQTLVNERQAAGYRSASFNAASLASGVYFYKLQAGSYIETRKMMLVK